MMPFLNLLVTLLFLASIVLIIYYAAIFFTRRTRAARVRILKLAIIPLAYFSCVAIICVYKFQSRKKELVKDLTGKYIYYDTLYNSDTMYINKASLSLENDKTFKFKNIQQSDTVLLGKWEIEGKSTRIHFTNVNGKILWEGNWRILTEGTSLRFISKEHKTIFIKQN